MNIEEEKDICRKIIKEINKLYEVKGMRSSERITPSLKAVEELWRKHPDMRLGQLIWMIAGRDPFYMEEDELIDNIAKLIAEESHGD